MSRSKLFAAAALAMAFSTPAAAATTINENFDGTDFGSGAGYVILPSYAGWNAVLGGGIEVQYNNVAGQAHSGENLIELDSTSNTQMTYGTPLQAGAYTLSFWYSDRPNVAAASNGIDVLLNATSILATLGGNGGATTNWILRTIDFIANDGDTLSFAALGTSDSYGGYIDDVRLGARDTRTVVPEPATWALLFLGFAAIGGAMRSPRRRLAAMAA
jgi:hypothetical protein